MCEGLRGAIVDSSGLALPLDLEVSILLLSVGSIYISTVMPKILLNSEKYKIEKTMYSGYWFCIDKLATV